MAEIKDELSEKMFPRVPRLVLLGSVSLAAVLCAGFVANAMLTRSQSPASSVPATAQMYVLPVEGASDTAAPILPAEPLPTAEVSPDSVASEAEKKVAVIPPKPLIKPAEAKAVAAKPRCEADECVSWETTVSKALAASAGPGQARVSPPHRAVRSGGPQPMPAAIEPPMAVPQDEPMLIEREASTVGGMAKSAATSVVTQSGRFVDNLMRWSDKAVTKLVTPPRWASADENSSPTP
ncbi:MAG: hypothetical protein P0Y66_15010 [Candidatus Kaistia colombiensis]|nr:MAG: hypothetical protein P0Y66_15010 [Kaistia sp.]